MNSYLIGNPYYNNKYYNNSYNSYNKYIDKKNELNSSDILSSEQIEYEGTDRKISSSNIFSNTSEDSTEYINILGIKLYFDDILLILLIYFLYTEGVKDIYLFFTLILLLLT